MASLIEINIYIKMENIHHILISKINIGQISKIMLNLTLLFWGINLPPIYCMKSKRKYTKILGIIGLSGDSLNILNFFNK